MNKKLHSDAVLLLEKRKSIFCDEVRLTGVKSLADAYAIQEQTGLLVGATVVGWKASLQTDGSLLSAPLLDCDTFNTGSTVPLPGRIGHGLECEIAFLLGSALPPRPNCGYTKFDVAPHVSCAMAAFEMLNSRLADAFQSPQTHLVADNLGNGGVVLGVPVYDWQKRSLSDLGITLSMDGKVIISKRYSHPVGDPFEVAVALANHLVERDLEWEPGQFAITGSHTAPHNVRVGSRVTASFDGFQPITLNIATEHGL